MLEVINLSKSFKGLTVLKNVSLRLEEPGLYILNGVNGSGKSTMLRLIAGMLYKSSGKILDNTTISYLPDRFTMPKLMRVKDYLEIIIGNKDNTERLISTYQIPNTLIGALSKGNLQKLGILQILNRDSEVYLFDEPIDGLDDFAKRLFKDEIKRKIKEDHAIILMSLHNKSYFNDLKPTVFNIKDGEINERKRRKEA